MTSTFRGYRSHPVFLERVQTFIAHNSAPANDDDSIAPSNPLFPTVHSSQQTTLQTQQIANKKPQVTSSDLRKKRAQINTNTYKGAGGSGAPSEAQKGPSYSVKLAISSGGLQADSF